MRTWQPCWCCKKFGSQLLGGRGWLTSAAYRRKAIELITEAHTAGAGLGGDFKEGSNPWAAFQAACISGSCPDSLSSSGG